MPGLTTRYLLTLVVAGVIAAAPIVLPAETIALERAGGTFLVPIRLNDAITLKATLDSGASTVTVPWDVFSTLIRTGTIRKSDLLDKQTYEMADGSKMSAWRFRIRSLQIGNVQVEDVVAAVSPAAGSLLLGQSFLARLDSWAVDNQKSVLIINGATAAAAESMPAQQRPPQPVRQSVTQGAGENRENLQEKYDNCVFALGASNCTELRGRLATVSPSGVAGDIAQDAYDRCVAFLGASECTDLKSRLDEIR